MKYIRKREKGNSKPWFERKEVITVRDKSHVDNEYFKERHNLVYITKNKKANFARNYIQKTPKKPKQLWKVLKNIGLPPKAAPISKIYLKKNHFTQFDKQNANTFKNVYSKLASDVINNIFRGISVKKYYSAMNIHFNSFKSINAKCEEIYKILTNIDSNKVYGIDEISGRFLKDGVELLTEPLCKIMNLSLSSKFPLMCRAIRVKPLYKKGNILNLKTIG